MNKGHRAMMFILFLLLGLLISLQFRGILQSDTVESNSVKELAAQLEAQEAENVKLMEQLANLEQEREQLIRNVGTNLNNAEINELLKKLDFENLRAGLVPVKGRGIVITMEDALFKGELDIEEYIIHDNDVNAIINQLKANGAQAISINGERLITNTRPICAGPTIIVNGNRYPPPYVIKAIGNPDVLYDAVDQMSEVAFMRLTNIRIDIVKQDEIIVDRVHLYKNIYEGLEVVN